MTVFCDFAGVCNNGCVEESSIYMHFKTFFFLRAIAFMVLLYYAFGTIFIKMLCFFNLNKQKIED
jgi:hypothetical protein